jgi:hypothetical protein
MQSCLLQSGQHKHESQPLLPQSKLGQGQSQFSTELHC